MVFLLYGFWWMIAASWLVLEKRSKVQECIYLLKGQLVIHMNKISLMHGMMDEIRTICDCRAICSFQIWRSSFQVWPGQRFHVLAAVDSGTWTCGSAAAKFGNCRELLWEGWCQTHTHTHTKHTHTHIHTYTKHTQSTLCQFTSEESSRSSMSTYFLLRGGCSTLSSSSVGISSWEKRRKLQIWKNAYFLNRFQTQPNLESEIWKLRFRLSIWKAKFGRVFSRCLQMIYRKKQLQFVNQHPYYSKLYTFSKTFTWWGKKSTRTRHTHTHPYTREIYSLYLNLNAQKKKKDWILKEILMLLFFTRGGQF